MLRDDHYQIGRYLVIRDGLDISLRAVRQEGNRKNPHGHAIPALDGTLPSATTETLALVTVGGQRKVVSVSDHNPEMLRYLCSQGIGPGTVLKLAERLPFEGGYRVLLAASKKPVFLK